MLASSWASCAKCSLPRALLVRALTCKAASIVGVPACQADSLAGRVENAVSSGLRLEVKVLVRSATDLDEIVAGHPMQAEFDNPARYFVAFLSAVADRDMALAVESDPSSDDRVWNRGAQAHLWCPAGYSALGRIAQMERPGS
jgi:uncharacterized protein (DUF1697 family)